MSSITSKYIIKEADLDKDRESVVKIWRDNLQCKYDPEEKYNWLFVNSPFGPGQIYQLVDTEQEQVVGVQGVSIRNFKNIHGALRIGLFSDFAVDTRHRTLGPGLKLINHTNTHGLNHCDMIYGFPNKKSLPVVKRAGFNCDNSMIRYSRPLKFGNLIEKFLPSIPTKLISPVLDFTGNLYNSIIFMPYKLKFRVDKNSRISNEFDGLWSESLKNNSSFMCERSEQSLSWRFYENREHDYKIMSLREKSSNKLSGYVVYYIDSKNICHVVDLLAKNFKTLLIPLIAGFIENIDSSLSVSIEMYAKPEIINMLLICGFRPRDSRPIVYTSKITGTDVEFDRLIFMSCDEDAI